MHDVAFLAARVMLSVIFILSGFAKLMAVSSTAAILQKAGLPQPQMLGYAVGLLELVGGVLVLIGFFTRWAALVLATLTIASIFLAHNFWDFEGQQYMAQRTQGLKNLAMAGGLLLLAFTGAGGWSADARNGRSRWR